MDALLNRRLPEVAIDVSENPEHLRPDEKVRVVDGTFTGYEGRIIGPEEAGQLGLRDYARSYGVHRSWIMLVIFGKNVPVQLMDWQFVRN
jgi:transcription antitermination factor NusG